MAEERAKGKRTQPAGDNGVMEAIRTLATVVQQQQAQIESILNAIGNGRDRQDVGYAEFSPPGMGGVEFGPPSEAGDGQNPEPAGEPKYPYSFSDGDHAKTDLVNLWFNTPREKLPELTETPRMCVTPTAYVEAMNEYIENMVSRKYESLDSIYIRRKDMRMKSVSRKSGLEAMAFSQIQQEQKEMGESQQAGF